MPAQLDQHDALVIVDMQNDFCAGGALPVPNCDRVVVTLNRWLAAATTGGALVVASRDWHPAEHVSFQAQGGPWPAHCVQGTSGAQFRDDLRLPADILLVSKGIQIDQDRYSAFSGDTDLLSELRKRGIRRLWIGGVALDYCVRATALDAVRAGFEVHLIRQGASSVATAAGEQAVREMRDAGVMIETELADAC